MLKNVTQQTRQEIQKTTEDTDMKLKISEVSEILSISSGTAEVLGLASVKMNELLTFKDDVTGLVQTLREDSVCVVFVTSQKDLKAGD